jgi:tetratricopeptide (TPR) repeat protein
MLPLDKQLDTLESTGLIRVATTFPELEYLFRHALIQDAAYNSLLKQDRRNLHRVVAETLEQFYGDQNAEFVPLIGHHFYAAGDDVRALKYYLSAAQIASSKYANVEALGYYNYAVEISLRLGITGEPLTELFLKRGRTHELNTAYDKALASYSELEKLALAIGDKTMEVAALAEQAKIYSTPNFEMNFDIAKEIAERGLSLADEIGDKVVEVRLLWSMMLMSRFSGGAEAVVYGERGISIARELNLREQLAYLLNDILYAYLSVGDIDKGIATTLEAQALWRELGNLPMLTDNLGNTASIYYYGGMYDDALAASEEARTLSRSIGNKWGEAFSQYSIEMIYFDRGDFIRGFEIIEDCVRLSDEANFFNPQVISRANGAFMYTTIGSFELADATLDIVFTIMEKLPPARPLAYIVKALICVKQGHLSEAAAFIAEAYKTLQPDVLISPKLLFIPLIEAEIKILHGDYANALALIEPTLQKFEHLQARAYTAEILDLKTRVLMALGEHEKAYEAAKEGLQAAENLKLVRTAWPLYASLAQLERGRGDEAAAQQYHTRACQTIAAIAENLKQLNLDVGFLNLPEVRAVLKV